MIQRRGRAGRTQVGVYIGLYEKSKRDVEEDDVRIRGAIDKLVLQAYVTSETRQWKVVKSAEWLLQQLPVPPSDEHLECADDALSTCGAVYQNRLTAFGRLATSLPIDLALSRMIYFALQ